MKNLCNLFCILLLGQLSFATTPINNPTSYMRIPVSAGHTFAPLGFDSNDDVELVITGMFPNMCYKYAKASTRVEKNNIFIELTALHPENVNVVCPRVMVPFMEVASVGTLNPGDYKVIINNNTKHASSSAISIAEAKSINIDDNIYANVTYAEQLNNSDVVLISGSNPSTCFKLDEVKLVTNKKDTYSVLPKLIQTSSLCPQVMTPFEYSFRVPKDISRKEVLLHIRRMNGKSYNKVYYR